VGGFSHSFSPYLSFKLARAEIRCGQATIFIAASILRLRPAVVKTLARRRAR
jgi:hypothetical protein